MLRLLVPAAVAACMLIVVPAAAAQAPAAKVSGAAAAREPRLATMTQQAARYWNDNLTRCTAGVEVELGDASSAPGAGAWAWAEVGGCTLWVNTSNRKAWPLRDGNLEPWCNVITHEFGHLRGLEHVNDPRNIMNPIVPDGEPPVHRVGWAGDERRRVRRRLGAHRGPPGPPPQDLRAFHPRQDARRQARRRRAGQGRAKRSSRRKSARCRSFAPPGRASGCTARAPDPRREDRGRSASAGPRRGPRPLLASRGALAARRPRRRAN